MKSLGAMTLLLLLSCHGESPTSPLPPTPPPPPPPASGTAIVAGTVYAPSGACIHGAVVEVLDGPRAGERLTQNECGSYWDYGPLGYSITSLPVGTSVRLRASKEGYRSKEQTFVATLGPERESNFELEPE